MEHRTRRQETSKEEVKPASEPLLQLEIALNDTPSHESSASHRHVAAQPLRRARFER